MSELESSSIDPTAAQILAEATLRNGSDFFLGDLASFINKNMLDQSVGAARALELIGDELVRRQND